MKYEVNLRFETRKKKIGSRPENEKPEHETLNSGFTLIGPFIDGQNIHRTGLPAEWRTRAKRKSPRHD